MTRLAPFEQLAPSKLTGKMTGLQALESANLTGWNVRKVPAMFQADNGDMTPMPGRFAIVRDNPDMPSQTDYLSDMGAVYHPVQNEEQAAFLDALVDEAGAHFTNAGSIDGGRVVFITMEVPSSIKIGGVDSISTHLTTVNSHDGSTPFAVLQAPLRIKCRNILNMNAPVFRVRHTRNGQLGIVQRAREALDLTFNYLDDFQAQAEQLIQTTLTQARFEEIVALEFGVPDDAPASTVTRAENKIDEMVHLFADADTQDNIRGTAWAGLNAITEWADHFSPVRGNDRDVVRARKAVLDPGFKNRALALMLQEV